MYISELSDNYFRSQIKKEKLKFKYYELVKTVIAKKVVKWYNVCQQILYEEKMLWLSYTLDMERWEALKQQMH